MGRRRIFWALFWRRELLRKRRILRWGRREWRVVTHRKCTNEEKRAS
jgi:hypothetical protein